MIKKLIAKNPALLKKLLNLKKITPLKMAKYAKKNTKIYGELYKSNPMEDFKTLPLLSKTQIKQSNAFDFLSKKEQKNVVIYGETTGSSGFPTPSFFTEQEFLGSLIFSRITPYYKYLKQILKENRVAVNGITHGFTIAGHSFGQLLQKNGFLCAHVGTRSTIATPYRIARLIARLKPSVIAASPVDFLSWMKIVEQDFKKDFDNVVYNLKALISTAELCADSRSQQIVNYFDIHHINTYACVEGFFSLPCPCGERHILPVYHAEVFDEGLNFIGEIGEGRFAFTNLIRKSTPFVRYLLDDYVKIYESDCPFGYKKSIYPYGRYEMMVNINGKKYGIGHFEDILFKYGFFGDYNVKIYNDKIKILAEIWAGRVDINNLKRHLYYLFRGKKIEIELLEFGQLTKYYEVRKTKPILKLIDLRQESTQKKPAFV